MKGTGQKILYLDFDGVLHPSDVYRDHRHGIYVQGLGHSLFENNEILEKIIAEFPDLKIVLSTSWVRFVSFHKSKKRLPLSVQERIVGATWHSYKTDPELWEIFYNFPYLTRYETIKMDVARRHPSDWIALDDDNEGWPVIEKHKLVDCHPDRGISSEKTQQKLRDGLSKMFEDNKENCLRSNLDNVNRLLLKP